MDYLRLTKADLDDLPKPTFSEVDGLLYPPFFTKERKVLIPEAVVRKDDVYVVTYPKCGRLLKILSSRNEKQYARRSTKEITHFRFTKTFF